MAKSDKLSKAESDEIIAEARTRFAYVDDVDGENRDDALEDTKFVYERGAQWDNETATKRKRLKLPMLQFNQLKQFVSQVVNDQRQGRPGVKFSPMGEGASDKVAKLKQELVRGIEVNSDAESAYDTGFMHAVVGGRGYWRIRTDYESRKSFNQTICIDRLPDPQAVRIDPDYQKADASDIQWAFVLESVKKADYERRYKDDPLSWSPGTDTKAWYPDDETVIVADYYRLVTSDRDLLLLEDHRVVWQDEYDEAKEAGYQMPAIVNKRKGEHVVCEWYTLGGGEKVLERHEWKGSYIPVVACIGDEIMIDGKRVYQGLIRHAREPQALLNYSMTQIAIRLASTPRAPYLAPVEAIAGFEALYQNANDENYGVLPYNHLGSDGNPIPAPQRQQGSDIDAGWSNWVQQMQAQVRSTIGMYENSLGMRASETSGKAILARERQGDNATFHYIDNLKRAIAHTGRVIDDLIPAYYDSERMVSLIEQDGAQKVAQVNGMMPVPDPEVEGAVRYVKDPDNDLTRGEYAVSIESGPTDATKREATRETLVELFQAFPPAAQVLGDKLMAVIDMPEAREAAERFKALLPPQIQQMEAAKAQGKAPPDPQMMQQLQQLQQQVQQAGQAVQALQAENQQLKQDQQVKLADAQMDAQVATQKAQLDAQTKVETTLIQVAGDLFAEHMGLRAQTAAAGGPVPPPVELGQIVAGVQGATDQVRASMEGGAPMPLPAMRVPEPQTGPSPDAIVILEGVNQIVGRMVGALTAPRAMKVEVDAMGNVIGGVSVPVPGGETIQ